MIASSVCFRYREPSVQDKKPDARGPLPNSSERRLVPDWNGIRFQARNSRKIYNPTGRLLTLRSCCLQDL